MDAADEKNTIAAAPVHGRRHVDPNIPLEAHQWVDGLSVEEYRRAQTRLRRKVSPQLPGTARRNGGGASAGAAGER